MKVYFITFGGGDPKYIGAVERICKQASGFNIFEKIYGITDKVLMEDKDFWEKHGKFILSNKKGYGYWIWKSYLIHKIMSSEEIKENDIIFYADSGCELNIKGKNRLLEYIELAIKNDIVTFQMTLPEKQFTKMSLIKHLNLSDEDINSSQLVGGISFIKKTKKNLDFIKEWHDLCISNNYKYVDDSESEVKNDPSFRAHRHDQSCFSCLVKTHKLFKIPDETWFSKWDKALDYPIFAMRTKSGKSKLKK
jgi:hypothetical protein